MYYLSSAWFELYKASMILHSVLKIAFFIQNQVLRFIHVIVHNCHPFVFSAAWHSTVWIHCNLFIPPAEGSRLVCSFCVGSSDVGDGLVPGSGSPPVRASQENVRVCDCPDPLPPEHSIWQDCIKHFPKRLYQLTLPPAVWDGFSSSASMPALATIRQFFKPTQWLWNRASFWSYFVFLRTHEVGNFYLFTIQKNPWPSKETEVICNKYD